MRKVVVAEIGVEIVLLTSLIVVAFLAMSVAPAAPAYPAPVLEGFTLGSAPILL